MPGRRLTAWLLLAAVFLHNLEEALGYAATRAEAQAFVRRAWPHFHAPSPEAFQMALLLLTLGAGAVLIWAANTARDRAGWLAVKITAAILLANVFVPHLPAAIALGGYAPGVVTAVAINLPLSLWVLMRRIGGGQS